MALYALIPPFLDHLPWNKSFARWISFMVSSNTAEYSIVHINTGFSQSSIFKEMFGLVGVWIVLLYWKILRCIAMCLLILLDFWRSACKEILGLVWVWQWHRYWSVFDCMAMYLVILSLLVPAALETFRLISVGPRYWYSRIPDCLEYNLPVFFLQRTYDNTMSSMPFK